MATFNNIVPLTKKWEGGLSRATSDTASKNPSPYTYKGKTGWHTNKGVTYTTFVDASKKLGFENNASNFLTMPDDLWNRIAKTFYWDGLSLDNLKSDAVSFQLFSWYWGAGTGWFPRMQRYLSQKGIKWNKTPKTLYQAINILLQKQGEKKTVDELQQQQIDFYKNLGQPKNEKGWINRVIDTTKFAYNYITDEFTQALAHPVQEVTKITEEVKKKLPDVKIPDIKLPDIPSIQTIVQKVKSNKKSTMLTIMVLFAIPVLYTAFSSKKG